MPSAIWRPCIWPTRLAAKPPGCGADAGALAGAAPVAAAAFHPSLAPVGVLLAVVGYIVGTAAAWFTGLVMMQVAAGAG